MECQAEEKSREESRARDLHDLHVGPDSIDNQDDDGAQISSIIVTSG